MVGIRCLFDRPAIIKTGHIYLQGWSKRFHSAVTCYGTHVDFWNRHI
jgi:hypothetical protein